MPNSYVATKVKMVGPRLGTTKLNLKAEIQTNTLSTQSFLVMVAGYGLEASHYTYGTTTLFNTVERHVGDSLQ